MSPANGFLAIAGVVIIWASSTPRQTFPTDRLGCFGFLAGVMCLALAVIL